MADEDYDFVVCLGDYIYAEAYHSVKDGTGVRDDRIGRDNPTNPDIVREAVTLQDYRDKYMLYRSDPLLRAVHSKFPMVMLWDDHEVQDNYAGKPADGGLPPGKHFSLRRKAAARRAFFESMPAFPGGTKLYRSLQFGKNVELFIMDQRSYRDNQPCDDAVVAPCADYNQPRDFLGRPQMNWLKGALDRSTAKWKVMANEVTIMPTRVLGTPPANYTYDNWLGYPQEREELLTHIRDQRINDVVFVTGDIHTFIAGDVKTGDGSTGDTVACELVGGSITSQSLGETNLDAGGGTVIRGNDTNPSTAPALIDALRGINPQVDNADFDHHGFGSVTASGSGLHLRDGADGHHQEEVHQEAPVGGLDLPRRAGLAVDQGPARARGRRRQRVLQVDLLRVDDAVAQRLHRRPGDREVLDRQAGGVEQRHGLRARAAGGLAGQDGAEVGDAVAGHEALLDGAGQLAAVRGLRPLVAEQRAGGDGADRRLRLAGAVGAEHVEVLAGVQVAGVDDDLGAGRDAADDLGVERLLAGPDGPAQLARPAPRAASGRGSKQTPGP